MAAAHGQDFTTYAGDAAFPQFTVLGANGQPIPITTVQEIVWTAQRSLDVAPVVSKLLTTGGIVLINSGVTGQFQVRILAPDTEDLTGFYIHEAVITDANGFPTTVSLGRMQVGRAPLWTYSGDPETSLRDKVRFYLQDTQPNRPILLDPEIDSLLLTYKTPAAAAGQGATIVAMKYAALADKAVGDLRISYSQIAKQYQDMAWFLQNLSLTSGLTGVYSGGTQRSDMATVNQDTNRNRPPFAIGQNDMFPPPEEGSIYNSGNAGGGNTPGNSGD